LWRRSIESAPLSWRDAIWDSGRCTCGH
jgi:hypothetical protein